MRIFLRRGLSNKRKECLTQLFKHQKTKYPHFVHIKLKLEYTFPDKLFIILMSNIMEIINSKTRIYIDLKKNHTNLKATIFCNEHR